VWAKYLNNGQTCIAPDYVLVPEGRKNELLTELKKEIKNQLDPKGTGIESNADYGHIISEKHHDKCVSNLNDAINKGAKIIAGGEYNSTSKYFAPTVLDNVTEEMDVIKEEIFGPILPIQTYKSNKDAIDIIAKKPKPLALYIQSNNQKFGATGLLHPPFTSTTEKLARFMGRWLG